MALRRTSAVAIMRSMRSTSSRLMDKVCHDCIHGQARRREKLIDPLDGVLVARGPSFGEFLLLQEAVDKRLQNAPAPYTLWRS